MTDSGKKMLGRFALTGALLFSASPAPAAGKVAEPPAPTITRYKIPNYRPAGGDFLENQGILDLAALDEPNRDASIVFIDGQNLGAADLTVYIKRGGQSQPGDVLERSATQIKARFRGFQPGALCVRRGDHEACTSSSVPRLAYRRLGVDFFTAIIGEVSMVLGSPAGQGTVKALGKTRNVTIGAYKDNGFDLRVNNLRSNHVTTTLVRDGNSGAILRLDIGFETGGNEMTGTFLKKISGWECGSFRVSNEQCSGLDVLCFGRVLGSALSSAASCLDPNHWHTTTWNGPSIPVNLNWSSPAIRIDVKIRAQGGNVAANGVDGRFTLQSVSSSVSGVNVPLDVIKGFIRDEVDNRVDAALPPMGLDTQLATPLNGILNAVFDGDVTHVTVTDGGSLFIELRKN